MGNKTVYGSLRKLRKHLIEFGAKEGQEMPLDLTHRVILHLSVLERRGLEELCSKKLSKKAPLLDSTYQEIMEDSLEYGFGV